MSHGRGAALQQWPVVSVVSVGWMQLMKMLSCWSTTRDADWQAEDDKSIGKTWVKLDWRATTVEARTRCHLERYTVPCNSMMYGTVSPSRPWLVTAPRHVLGTATAGATVLAGITRVFTTCLPLWPVLDIRYIALLQEIRGPPPWNSDLALPSQIRSWQSAAASVLTLT